MRGRARLNVPVSFVSSVLLPTDGNPTRPTRESPTWAEAQRAAARVLPVRHCRSRHSAPWSRRSPRPCPRRRPCSAQAALVAAWPAWPARRDVSAAAGFRHSGDGFAPSQLCGVRRAAPRLQAAEVAAGCLVLLRASHLVLDALNLVHDCRHDVCSGHSEARATALSKMSRCNVSRERGSPPPHELEHGHCYKRSCSFTGSWAKRSRVAPSKHEEAAAWCAGGCWVLARS